MNAYVVAFQCHCLQQNRDRIVTEACGHSKCRNCFIKEESGCVKCLSSNKNRDDQHRSISEAKTITKNDQDNSDDRIQMKSIVSVVSNVGTVSRLMSKPKDIRVLEEVIIKPSSNDSLAFPRMREQQKFKYPPHITWQLVNGKTEFECKICKKSFRSKSNRKYHLYCDGTVKKPFNCTKCPKTFVTKSHLDYHDESRHKNTEHNCSECGRKFLSRVSLQKHLKVHTNDYKYICDHCDMKFYNKSELILHMYSHKKSSPLPFPCDLCDKSFAAKFKLNQHQETHRDIKSHRCQICGKTFTRNSSLTIHMLTHSSSETKYECNVCSKSFDRQRSHDRHMKIKHGSTAFQCPLCDIQSGRKDNILRHIRNLHSDGNFDAITKKISRKVARHNLRDGIEVPETVPDVNQMATEILNFEQSSKVCQYQSVIQFAGRSGRSKTPNPVPVNVTDECATNAEASSANTNENIDDNPHQSFNKELRIELEEPNDLSDKKISNISIYRQLLSPYLRPPPNLNRRNGAQAQDEHRGYQDQSDRLPMRKENVDIYRSILMSTAEPEQPTVIQNNLGVAAQKDATNDETSLVIHGQSSEYFSEMHWRKRTSQCFNRMKQ